MILERILHEQKAASREGSFHFVAAQDDAGRIPVFIVKAKIFLGGLGQKLHVVAIDSRKLRQIRARPSIMVLELPSHTGLLGQFRGVEIELRRSQILPILVDVAVRNPVTQQNGVRNSFVLLSWSTGSVTMR